MIQKPLLRRLSEWFFALERFISIYWRKKEKIKDEAVALVRLEQLDPLPRKQLAKLQTKYKNAEWVWCQEEPLNMGAWSHILRKLRQINFEVIGRPTSGAPATGSGQRHRAEQKMLVKNAFSDI